MSTHPAMTQAMLQPPPPAPPPPPPAPPLNYKPVTEPPPPPGLGHWPWWTPLAALVIGSVVALPLVLLLDGVDFPFHATVDEALFVGALLVSAFVLAARFGTRPRPALLGLRATPARAAVGWVVAARMGFTVCVAVYVGFVRHVTPNVPLHPVGHLSTLEQLDIVIAAVVLAPVGEELFFRGFLYGALRGRLPVFWSAVVSAGLFGALHPIYGPTAWNLVPVIALGGMAMCLLYERTASLWPAIGFHFAMNVGVLYLVTGSTALPVLIVVGVGGLFLLAPWRWFRRAAPPLPPAPPPGSDRATAAAPG